jgi:hypothetical protein
VKLEQEFETGSNEDSGILRIKGGFGYKTCSFKESTDLKKPLNATSGNGRA